VERERLRASKESRIVQKVESLLVSGESGQMSERNQKQAQKQYETNRTRERMWERGESLQSRGGGLSGIRTRRSWAAGAKSVSVCSARMESSPHTFSEDMSVVDCKQAAAATEDSIGS
jgi:hypothetical protein